MASSSYKVCTVPCCTSTTIKNPNKLFIHVPQSGPLRKKWLQLARRDPSTVSPKSSIYFCEDHFDLPNDMENYMEYHIMGSVSAIRMKPSCVPTKFECQPDRLKRTATTMPRSAIKSSSQVVCYNCHSILKKIKLFTLQVKNNFKHITKTSIDSDINKTIDSKEVTNQTPEMIVKPKSLKAYERKIKNIGNALKIIESNQNSACINILATSLNSISNSLLNKSIDLNNISVLNNIISNANVGSRNTEKIILKTENLMEVDKKTIDMADHVLGAEGNFGIKKNIFVDKIDKELEIP
ncbi:hypothetical protein HF086_015761, partial [Spodoptera exigua]